MQKVDTNQTLCSHTFKILYYTLKIKQISYSSLWENKFTILSPLPKDYLSKERQ